MKMDRSWMIIGAPALVILLEGARQFALSFFTGAMFAVVTVLWVLDWCLGGLVALKRRDWRARRAFWSIFKWLSYVVALATVALIRLVLPPYLGFTVGLVESAIVLTEGASILRNLGLLWPEGSTLGRLFARIVDAFPRYEDELDKTKQELKKTSERKELWKSAVKEIDPPKWEELRQDDPDPEPCPPRYEHPRSEKTSNPKQKE